MDTRQTSERPTIGPWPIIFGLGSFESALGPCANLHMKSLDFAV